MSAPLRPAPPPIDNDGVRIVTIGTVVWAIAFVVLLFFRDELKEDGNEWWITTCACGAVLGVAGIWYCRRRRAALRRGEPTAL